MIDILSNIQVYFTKESGLHDINIKSELVDEIFIEDGFLKIHDIHENCWRNYKLKYVIHFHVLGGIEHDQDKH